MDIPMKYEDVVAKLDAALGREAALREELDAANRAKGIAVSLSVDVKVERDALQQRLTVAEQLLSEALCHAQRMEPISASLFNRIDSAIGVSLKPAAEVEALGTRPVGCCCPPKGHTGIWAAAMCPAHFGLKRHGVSHDQ